MSEILEKEKKELTVDQISNRLSQIDYRVSQLERTSSMHPDHSEGVYNLIQKLMDERDELVAKRNALY